MIVRRIQVRIQAQSPHVIGYYVGICVNITPLMYFNEFICIPNNNIGMMLIA